jgi:AraC family transcriptional regulator
LALVMPGKAATFHGSAPRHVTLVSIPAKTVDSVLSFSDVAPLRLLSRLQDRIFQDSMITSALLSMWADLEAVPGLESTYVEQSLELIAARLGLLAVSDHDDDKGAKPTTVSGRIGELVDYVNGNLGAPLTLEELSNLIGCSPFHLARMFRQETGQTVHDFVLSRRLARARDLLAAGQVPIAEIARQTGFSSQSHLTSVFKRFEGTTPADYRRRAAG